MENREFVILEFELLEGGDMRRYMIARGQPMAEDAAKAVVRSLISAVAYIHMQRIIHKDIKLDKIVIKTKSDFTSVQLSGFHVSESVRTIGDGLKAPGQGSLPYLPPEAMNAYMHEQEDGNPTAATSGKDLIKGPPLDVWSLGVVFFVLVTGRLPFGGPPLSVYTPLSMNTKKDIRCAFEGYPSWVRLAPPHIQALLPLPLAQPQHPRLSVQHGRAPVGRDEATHHPPAAPRPRGAHRDNRAGQPHPVARRRQDGQRRRACAVAVAGVAVRGAGKLVDVAGRRAVQADHPWEGRRWRRGRW